MTPSAGDSSRKKLPKPKAAKRGGPHPEAVQGDRLCAEQVLLALHGDDLDELYRFWIGERKRPGSSSEATRAEVLACMLDAEILAARVEQMGQRLLALFDVLLSSPRFELSYADLSTDRQLAYLSKYDLEATLALLERHALLAPSRCKRADQYGTRAYQVPFDLGETVLRMRRAARRGVFDVFALRGHLERLNNNPARKRKLSAKRQREFYKLYSNESAAVARIEHLPDGLRPLVEKVVLEFGGLFTKDLFERMEHDMPHWNGRRWGKILEESMVGTVERLDLMRYGIAHSDETLIIFNEVALAWLKRVAVPSDPDAPRQEASLGVDIVSNLSRFLGYILENNVRFTVRGQIFKTTEQRILQDLIPNPGRELERTEVLAFIYSFVRHKHLIENTGERTFALSAVGREWEPQSLEQKMATLIDYVAQEPALGGEYFHQSRLRQIFMRLLKRIEVGVWYDLMYLPFLARNTYLSNLDELAVEDYFQSNGQAQKAPQEDLQRLAWNLVSWVRKRLYLIGMIDLGYDGHGRPVAMRLTRMGAKLLGVAAETVESAGIGNLIVTPDFEVVLFPTGDDGELVHDLDRFCARAKDRQTSHFKIVEKGVQRALAEGMLLQRICSTLVQNSRTPVPQNVLYSIQDWASQAGLMRITSSHHLSCENPEVLERLLGDPGVKAYISRVLGGQRVRLKSSSTPRRLVSVLRELGYLAEFSE